MDRAAIQLRRGPQNLSRPAVRANQRARVVQAIIECVAEHGYHPVTIGQIVELAGVSRETFYQLFEDKEECYRRSLDDTISESISSWRLASSDSSLSAADRLQAGLMDYFNSLAQNPTAARCFLLERPSNRRLTEDDDPASERVVEAVATLLGTDDAFAVRAYLILVDGIVRQHAIAEQTVDLPEQVPELMRIVRRMLALDPVA